MFSTTSQKYIHEVPTLGPQNMYVGSNGLIRNYAALPSTKESYMTIQTVVLTFTVLFCIFSCFLTVTLSYKWHTDTNVMIGRLEGTVGELVRDVGTLTDLLKEEIAIRRLNNHHKEEPKNDKDENNYDDLEDDYDENRFMGKDLFDNKRPTKNNQDNDSHEINHRERRNAEIDTAIKVKNELNSPVNEKSNVEFYEEETTTEENTVKLYNRRNPKKERIAKKKTQIEDESMEDVKKVQEIAAAHFSSDYSKYNTRIHAHYNGNGRLRHPDGDFKDWTHCIWDANLNNANYIQMKNGKVEISKSGVYFVYAQIYYSDQHDINGYYVMRNDEKVLGCTTTRHRETQSDSCYTGGLIYFNTNDLLSIKGLDSERYILLDHVKTFFGLFKVSKD